MTTAAATSAAIALCPGKTVICVERYQSTHHGDYRVEGLECTISIHPSLDGEAPCQQFTRPTFEGCLAILKNSIKANS